LGSSINDVTALGGGGVKHFVTIVLRPSHYKVWRWGSGVENNKKNSWHHLSMTPYHNGSTINDVTQTWKFDNLKFQLLNWNMSLFVWDYLSLSSTIIGWSYFIVLWWVQLVWMLIRKILDYIAWVCSNQMAHKWIQFIFLKVWRHLWIPLSSPDLDS